MVINLSGIMAVCYLLVIMRKDVISLSGTIMVHCASSLHHIKKLRILRARTLVSWTPPTTLYVQNPQRLLQRVTMMVSVEDRVETR